MSRSAAAILLSVVLAAHVATRVSAEPPAPRPSSETSPLEASPAALPEAERVTLGASLRVGPLEAYPVVGASFGVLRRFGRFRVGGEFTLYAPKDLGDARRFAASMGAVAERVFTLGARARFLIGAGLDLAILRDDFVPQSYFRDRTQLAPGLTLDVGLEIRATARTSVVVDLRGAYYFAGRITDHEWLDLGVGVRVGLR